MPVSPASVTQNCEKEQEGRTEGNRFLREKIYHPFRKLLAGISMLLPLTLRNSKFDNKLHVCLFNI